MDLKFYGDWSSLGMMKHYSKSGPKPNDLRSQRVNEANFQPVIKLKSAK